MTNCQIIVGFGSYHYKYARGREANWMLIGFSPRKQNITLYIMAAGWYYGICEADSTPLPTWRIKDLLPAVTRDRRPSRKAGDARPHCD